MDGQRRFERFNIDIMNVTGRIVWSHVVNINTITQDTIILSTDARMNLGKKYILHVEHQKSSFRVSGVVTASSIGAATLSPEGETAPLYCTEIRLDNRTGQCREDIQSFMGLLSQETRPGLQELKLWLDIPGETNAITEPYRVKEIGMGGMRIECPSPHEVGCTFRIMLSLPSVSPLRIRAKVVWCLQSGASYDTGLSFSRLPETDLLQLEAFVQHLRHPLETVADFWTQKPY